jgi:hypothetical protein
MCENAEMCFRAGKDFQVDYFNFGQAVATGRRTSAGLDAKISSRYFAAIQLELGPTSLRLPDTTNAAIEANYRVILTDPVYIAIPR